jgi:hypothetical protein
MPSSNFRDFQIDMGDSMFSAYTSNFSSDFGSNFIKCPTHACYLQHLEHAWEGHRFKRVLSNFKICYFGNISIFSNWSQF